MVVSSAGRSRKGDGKYNWDFFCRQEFPAGSPIRGLYAVADGAPSPSRGDLASELAAETLKEYFQHFKSGRAGGPSETTNLLKQCFAEINTTLLKHKIARREGEEETWPMRACLTAGYQFENTLHVGHAGTGCLYMITGGKIQRLTDEHPAAPPAEGASDRDGAVEYGVLGLKEHGYRTDFFSIPIEESTVLVFCTDGAAANTGSLALLECWLDTRSPDGMVERVMRALDGKGAAEDATIVVQQAEVQREESGRFIHPIRYPAHVVFRKYLLVTALLTVLTTMLVFRSTLVGRLTPQAAKTETAAGLYESNGEAGGSYAEGAGPAAAAVREYEFTLSVVPPDARVYVNGRQAEGGSPHTLRLEAGTPAEILVERDGWQPFRTTLDGSAAEPRELSVTLKRTPPPGGTLRVFCDNLCSSVTIDGEPVRTTYPRNYVVQSGLSAGAHSVRATSEGETQEKRVRVTVGEAAVARFAFAEEEDFRVAERPAPEAPRAAEPKRLKTAPEKAAPAQPARSPAAEISKPPERVFFTVKTNVPGCSLMVFQDNQLVLTGAGGERLDLPPGEYVIEANKEGYRPTAKKVSLGERYQIIELRLQ